jgi:hypothetical protein
MDLAKVVSMLDHNALYFPVLAALNDDLEGSLPRVPPWGLRLEREDGLELLVHHQGFRVRQLLAQFA